MLMKHYPLLFFNITQHIGVILVKIEMTLGVELLLHIAY